MTSNRGAPVSSAGEVFAEIMVDVAAAQTDRRFHYRIPPDLDVRPGCVVTVPFGPRRLSGFVVGLTDRSDVPPERLRPIHSLLDPEPLLPETLLTLAEWIANRYVCLFVQVLRAMLPPGARGAGVGARRAVAVRPQVSLEILEEEQRRRLRKAPRQAEAIRRLVARLRNGEDTVWLSELAKGKGMRYDVFQTLARQGLIALETASKTRDPYPSDPMRSPRQPAALTEEQEAALSRILAPLQSRRFGAVLLQGVTGSGKTEIYLHAIQRCLAMGRRAILLVPEISLTPQLIGRFKAIFGSRVAVLHSALSEGERFDEWSRARRGEADLVIGARSAVFAPLHSLGLIIVDEEHASGYKQEEAPRYHARDVAEKRAELEGAVLVLGSATPSLETVYAARQGLRDRVLLTRRWGDRPLPRARILDMRSAGREAYRGVLAADMIAAIRQRLHRREQVLLFLNRRGYATFLMCRDCGTSLRCEHCAVTFTYHRFDRVLRCHYCAASLRPPDRCPHCSGNRIGYLGTGTQRVEEAVRELFPDARVARMDTDTTTRRGSHDRLYHALRQGHIDILVGTQMIARGWDIPKITLVGVISADTALHLPDFRSTERTYELLVQVAGRAGRGEEPGEVLVQTYHPDHYAIRAAILGDDEGFYQEELAVRESLGYPPFRRLMRLLYWGPREDPVRAAAEEGAERIRKGFADPRDLEVLGPAPAPLERIRGAFRWHVLVKAEDGASLAAAAREVRESPSLRDPRRVRMAVDIDPQSLL